MAARQLAIKVDRTPVIARDYACIFNLCSVQAHQNDVPLGPFTLAQSPRTSTSIDSGLYPETV